MTDLEGLSSRVTMLYDAECYAEAAQEIALMRSAGVPVRAFTLHKTEASMLSRRRRDDDDDEEAEEDFANEAIRLARDAIVENCASIETIELCAYPTCALIDEEVTEIFAALERCLVVRDLSISHVIWGTRGPRVLSRFLASSASLRNLHIASARVRDEAAYASILDAVSPTRLESLSFDHGALRGIPLERLGKALCVMQSSSVSPSSSLRSLSIRREQFHAQGVEAICAALDCPNLHLENLTLSGEMNAGDIHELHETLADGIGKCTTLRRLTLRLRDAKEEEARPYAEILRRLPHLVSYEFSENHMGNKGAEAFATVLNETCGSLPELREVNLDATGMDDAGARCVIEAMKNLKSCARRQQQHPPRLVLGERNPRISRRLLYEAYLLSDPMATEEETFSTCGCRLEDHDVIKLCEAIEAGGKTATTSWVPARIDLSSTRVTCEGLVELARVLGNAKVKSRAPGGGGFSVNLSRCRYVRSRGASAMIRAMMRNPHFESLDLSRVAVGDEGVEAWCDYFHLRFLPQDQNNANRRDIMPLDFPSLYGARITARGVRALSSLMECLPLRTLTMVNNPLDTDAMSTLLRAVILYGAQSLASLTLIDVGFGDREARELGEALPRMAALRALHVSNARGAQFAGRLTGEGVVQIFRGHEASRVRRTLDVQMMGGAIAEARRAFRCVLSTSRHLPLSMRGGAAEELMRRICDYYAPPYPAFVEPPMLEWARREDDDSGEENNNARQGEDRSCGGEFGLNSSSSWVG